MFTVLPGGFDCNREGWLNNFLPLKRGWGLIREGGLVGGGKLNGEFYTIK